MEQCDPSRPVGQDGCPPELKCCSNGCGHVCVRPGNILSTIFTDIIVFILPHWHILYQVFYEQMIKLVGVNIDALLYFQFDFGLLKIGVTGVH